MLLNDIALSCHAKYSGRKDPKTKNFGCVKITKYINE